MRYRCLIIMPYSQSSDQHTEEYWTTHFQKFLKPIVEEVPTLEAHRINPTHGDILRQIITDLVICPIVIAELTDHNPNVFWELGVRQSFKHNTITIAEKGTVIPFDISSKATLFYNPNDHLRIIEFRERLREALIDCINNPDKTDSHVLETISGRGSLFEMMRLDEAKRRLEALIAECKRNWELLNNIFTHPNKANREKRYGGFPLRLHFDVKAMELLLTNRYLDEPLKFYLTCESYYSTVDAINRYFFELKSLDEQYKSILQWKGKTGIERAFKVILTALESVYKKLQEKTMTVNSKISIATK